MEVELVAGFSYFVYVTLKAIQQRNVAWMRYWPVLPIGYLMAMAEVTVISTVSYRAFTLFPLDLETVKGMLPMMFAVGTGSGFGALLGMFLHHRYIGENDEQVH